MKKKINCQACPYLHHDRFGDRCRRWDSYRFPDLCLPYSVVYLTLSGAGWVGGWGAVIHTAVLGLIRGPLSTHWPVHQWLLLIILEELDQNRMIPLTHLPLDKMAAVWADDIFKWISLNKNDSIQIQISLKFVPKSPIDNKSALVQVMAWCRTGNKPLPEPMMTPVYQRIYAALGGDELFKDRFIRLVTLVC